MTEAPDKNLTKLTPLTTESHATAHAKDTMRGAKVDKLFDQPRGFIGDFEFDASTVAVFDDMVGRSVPYYQEIQRMVCELSAEFAVPGTRLYDLGCATGTTLHALHDLVDPDVRFIGIDNSNDMLDAARKKLKPLHEQRRIELITADLNDGVVISDASVVILLLSMMFVRPLRREQLMKRIVDGLPQNGCLIMVEKISGAHTLLNRLFIKNYYEYKKREGYSQMEIAQKRESLENVLIPYRFEENIDLLQTAGFNQVDEFFRWYNFCGIVAVK